jgi:hypothetical protein
MVKAVVTQLPTFGELYQYNSVTQSAGALITNNNTIVTDIENRVVYKAPTSSLVATIPLSFKLVDSCGASSEETVCNINLDVSNSRPIAQAPLENIIMNEDERVTIQLGGIDPAGNPLSSFIVSFPSAGKLYIPETQIQVTQEHPNLPGNEVDFVPDPNTYGTGFDNFYAQFTYKVMTSTSLESANHVVIRIFVDPVNDPPIARNQAFTTEEDTILTILLSVADNETPGNLTIFIGQTPTKGILRLCTNCADIQQDSELPLGIYSLLYFPNENINGADSFTYMVNDGEFNSAEAVVTITISAVNDKPIAFPLNVTTMEDTPIVINLNGTDIEDDNDSLSAVICGWNGRGVLTQFNGTVIPKLQVTTVEDAQRRVIYHPPIDQYSTFPNYLDTFLFKLKDTENENSQCVEVNIHVEAVNDLPVAYALSPLVVAEDNYTVIALHGIDVDTEDHPLLFKICTIPDLGTLYQYDNATIEEDDTVTNITIVSSTRTVGNIIYKPNSNQFGNDSFSFRVSDGKNESNCFLVDIIITQVNDRPIAIPPSTSILTNQSIPVKIQLDGYDPDPNDELKFIVTSLSLIGGSLFQVDEDGNRGAQITDVPTVVSNLNGIVEYEPEFYTFGLASFEFVAFDSILHSLPATVTIEILQVNSEPIAVADTPVVTQENKSTRIFLTGMDIEDSPSELRIVINSLPDRGTLWICNDVNCDDIVLAGIDDVAPVGFVLYSPPQGENDEGNPPFTDFTFYVKDTGNLTSPIMVIEIWVTPTNGMYRNYDTI